MTNHQYYEIVKRLEQIIEMLSKVPGLSRETKRVAEDKK